MFEGLLLLVIRPDHAKFLNESSEPISKALELRIDRACNIARFAGAGLTADLNDENVTHVVIVGEGTNTRGVRREISVYGFCSQIFFSKTMANRTL